MRLLSLDVETTKKPLIHPWHEGSYLVAPGVLDTRTNKPQTWLFNHPEATIPQRKIIEALDREIGKADLVVGHNIKFDLNWMLSLGIDITKTPVWCTMIVEYLIQGQVKHRSYSLAVVSDDYGIPPKLDVVKEYWDNGVETDDIPAKILIPYLERDLENPLKIYAEQIKKVKSLGLEKIVKLSMAVLPILCEIEMNGMDFDLPTAKKFAVEYGARLAEVDSVLEGLFGFDINLGSGDDLSAGLYGGTIKRDSREEYWQTLVTGAIKKKSRKCTKEHTIPGLGFSPPRGSELKKEGYFATDKNTLFVLQAKTTDQRRAKELLVEHSELSKQLSTYFVGLQSKIGNDGRIHPNMNQGTTATGRLSSSNPNGQNFPRGGSSPVKTVFKPRNDGIMNADLAQIEWRAAAWLSQDKIMMDEILKGRDAHLANAIAFFGDGKFRQDTKIFNFRMIYGGSAFSFFMDTKMPNFSKKKWVGIVNQFYSKYAGLKDRQDEWFKELNNTGQIINPTGRILKPQMRLQRDGSMGYHRPQACNYPVQSISADIIYLAMVVTRRRMAAMGLKTPMILQVHDSIVFDYIESEKKALAKLCLEVFDELPTLIKKYFGLDWNVPLSGDIEVGPDYGTQSKYDYTLAE